MHLIDNRVFSARQRELEKVQFGATTKNQKSMHFRNKTFGSELKGLNLEMNLKIKTK